jgi:hypothetical protein
VRTGVTDACDRDEAEGQADHRASDAAAAQLRGGRTLRLVAGHVTTPDRLTMRT